MNAEQWAKVNAQDATVALDASRAGTTGRTQGVIAVPAPAISANSISNREVVLGLANKDGGAHVDGSGNPNYRKAKQQGQMFFGQQLSNIAKMGHLAAIAGDFSEFW